MKQNIFKRLGSMKSQIVGIKDRFNALRNFDIQARIVDKDPRIDEICLPLNLAASETRQKTVRLDQSDACLCQSDPISIPE